MPIRHRPADRLKQYKSNSSGLRLEEVKTLHDLKKDGWGFFLYWLIICFAVFGGFLVGMISNEEKAKTAGFAASAGALGAVFKQRLDKSE